MPHRYELKVRSYELDGYQHVNNAVYLNYLEAARVEWLASYGIDFNKMVAEGRGLFVSEIHIEYKSPAGGGETLSIETENIEMGATYGVARQTVRAGGRLVAEARVTWVCTNAQGRPTRVWEDLKRLAEPLH